MKKTWQFAQEQKVSIVESAGGGWDQTGASNKEVFITRDMRITE